MRIPKLLPKERQIKQHLHIHPWVRCSMCFDPSSRSTRSTTGSKGCLWALDPTKHLIWQDARVRARRYSRALRGWAGLVAFSSEKLRLVRAALGEDMGEELVRLKASFGDRKASFGPDTAVSVGTERGHRKEHVSVTWWFSKHCWSHEGEEGTTVGWLTLAIHMS